MRLTHEYLDIPGEFAPIRSYLALPRDREKAPGLLLYSDIFQLTPSTLRLADRFAGYGFAVLVPEIYSRRIPAGTAWAFDDAGREAGMAAAKATSVRDFDDDAQRLVKAMAANPRIDADNLNVVGFCLGGHLAFRAASLPQIRAAVCYYPTGLHNGALGSDPDAGTLQQIGARPSKRLHLVFGTEDPHIPEPARAMILSSLASKSITFELSTYQTEHAFMRDEGPRFDPEATDQAFAAGLRTLL